jgi:lipase
MAEPVLFIHGLQHSFGHVGAMAAESLAPHRVIVADLLGYGANAAAPADKLSISAQADYLAGLLRAEGCEAAHLVAHSMGGAVAVLFARRYPERVASLINVEGNFTLKDAFWSKALAAMSVRAIRRMIDRDRADPAGWLRRLEIAPTPERLAGAERVLGLQGAETMQRMALSIIKTTAPASYLEAVATMLRAGIPLHLLAGARSLGAWDVPGFVAQAAASLTVQPDSGHVMMMDDPRAFLRLVRGCLAASGA